MFSEYNSEDNDNNDVSLNDVFARLRIVIASETVHNEGDLVPDAHIEKELDINLVDSFPFLLTKINEEFDMSLESDDTLDELEEMGGTIGDLLKIINEELELG